MNKIAVALGIIWSSQDKKVLLAQRPQGKPFAGYWEFPGGKYEKNESPEAALCRELSEEIAIRPTCFESLSEVTYQRETVEITLHAWFITAYEGTPCGNEGQTIEWVSPEELKCRHFPPANEAIIKIFLDKITDLG